VTTNVLMAGVGGQGVVTASAVVARAALLAGWEVKKSEIHGMSQRGGSVVSHVRLAPDGEIFSPIIPAGEVDLLIGFELLETLRALSYARRGAHIIVDPRRIPPAPVSLGLAEYPDDALQRIQEGDYQVHVAAGTTVAAQLGEVRAANSVLLGAASRLLPLPAEAWQQALRLTLKASIVQVNLEAFNRGREFVPQPAG